MPLFGVFSFPAFGLNMEKYGLCLNINVLRPKLIEPESIHLTSMHHCASPITAMNYLFQVNIRNTRTNYEICLKLTIDTMLESLFNKVADPQTCFCSKL